MIFGDNPQLLILLAPPLLLSLVLHELAHARVALAFGDPTALRAGRITLNPLKHLDPVGTIALLFMGFGWAKPVPVNPYLLRPQRLGNIMVSLAGPLTNLALAIVAGCVMKIMATLPDLDGHASIASLIFVTLYITMGINIVLCIFNMIPLAPLDGHHILRELLPANQRADYDMFQRKYGMFLLLVLVAGPRILSYTSGKYVPSPISWVRDNVMTLVENIFGLV